VLQGSDLVFPPTRGRHIETTRLWGRIRTRAGIRSDLTLHGLRHSVGTVAALRGLGILEVKAILRHRQTSTSERYVKAAEIAKTRHLDGIADFMTTPKLVPDA
jgi:integrase